MLDPETLKAVGVATIGQRLTILKAIYQAKLAYHIPIDSDHYVPPCMSTSPTVLSIEPCLAAEAHERAISVEKLNDLVREQGRCLPSVLLSPPSLFPGFTAQRVSHLEEDNRRLKETVDLLLDEFNQVRNSQRLVRAL